jgi:putative transposase
MTINNRISKIEPAVVRKYPYHAPMNPLHENNLIFLTVCTKDRMPWLDNDVAHHVLRELWSDRSHWIVGPYILMPDHVHLIAAPASSQKSSLKDWTAWWKRLSTRRFEDPIAGWQKGFWDTRLRDPRHVAEKIHYMRLNPARKGLVNEGSAWRFQGVIHSI